MEEIISIDNLIFNYEGVGGESRNAVDGVSFSIEKGSFTAVIGRNGSGKSTLAKCINGLLTPSSGTVKVAGYNTKNEDDIWEIRQRVGMVFQNPDNQIVSAIVEDDVAFGPENLGIAPSVIRERVDSSLEAVNMMDYSKKAPHLLSGGQKQRIAIAGAVAMRPECIVFDEPTAMLDPKGRREVVKIIQELNGEGITCVLITHFMEEASEANRIIVMDGGKVKIDGNPKEVFARAEELKAMDLDVPMAVELANRLKAKGMPLKEDIIDGKGLLDSLCRL